MSDLTFKHDEPACGAGHASLEDSLNRLKLAGGMRDTDGKNNWATYKVQTSDPSTTANEIALYCKSNGSYLTFFKRDESNGAVSEM